MLRLICYITGNNFEKLKSSSYKSIRKVIAQGIALLIPVFLWILTGFMLTKYILGNSTIIGIIVAFILGVIIYSIEKIILLSDGKRIMHVFRIILGVLLSFIGSIALDEMIFNDDINLQILLDKEILVKSEIKDFDKKTLKTRSHLQKELFLKEKELFDAIKRAEDELNGVGSGIVGNGKIYKQKKALINDYYEPNVDVARLALLNFENETNLKRQKINDSINEKYTQSAFLLRIKALFNLLKQDNYILIIYLIFTAIMMLLEFSVMIVKYGFEKTSYEYDLEQEEYIATIYRDKKHRLMSRLIDRGDNAKLFSDIKSSTLKPIPTIFSKQF